MYANLTTNDGLNNGEKIAYLYNTYGQGTINPSNPQYNAYLTANSLTTSQLSSSDYAAGLQLSIWTLLNSTFSYTHSDVSAATNSLVTFFLGQAASSPNPNRGNAAAVWLPPYPPPGGQGFIGPSSGSSTIVTPEPTSIAAWSGLLVLGVVASRRRRRTPAS